MVSPSLQTQYQLQTSVVSVDQLTHDIVRLTLLAPEICRVAQPGQFVMVKVGEGLDPLLRRPFSVHFCGNDGLLQLLIKIVGPVTRTMADLVAGEKINIIGPLGRGFPIIKDSPVYLLGGGIGAAPLLFLAECLQEKYQVDDIKVLLGARNGSEARAVAKEFVRFGLEPQLATDDGSVGHSGVVGDLLDGLPPEKNPVVVYACGPYPMLAGVADICRKRGLLCYVSMETMMACGVKACLGCAVSSAELGAGYVHVCKDGPVFNAGDLQW